MSQSTGSAAPSAPAPQGNSSAGPSGASETGGGSPQPFDYKKAFESQRGEFSKTQQQLSKTMQEFGKVKESFSRDSETLGRIREVFSPSKEAPGDPVLSEYESMLDYYIGQGVEAEKAGKPMPLTINNGITMYKKLIEQHEKEQKQNAKLDAMERQLKQLSDPQQHINQQAYSSIDQHIQRGIESLFGNSPESLEQRRNIFNSVGQSLVPVIKRMMNENPGQWDQIRRNPQHLADLANRALKSHIPPKALQMMAEDELRNTEMPLSELHTAFREAEKIQDPRERQSVRTQIRQEILTRMYTTGRLKADKR